MEWFSMASRVSKVQLAPPAGNIYGIWRYTNADLKICHYLCVHIKISTYIWLYYKNLKTFVKNNEEKEKLSKNF